MNCEITALVASRPAVADPGSLAQAARLPLGRAAALALARVLVRLHPEAFGPLGQRNT